MNAPASRQQRRLINALVQQIANYTGDSFDEIKIFAKRLALSRGYPLMVRDGDYVYMDGEPMAESETRIDVEEASQLIESLYQLLAELGVLYQGGSHDRRR